MDYIREKPRKTHDIKTHPQFFAEVLSGAKRFEIRLNDRDYQVGDILNLHEWQPVPDFTLETNREREGYSGRVYSVVVTYITDFPQGLQEKYVCMSIEPCTVIVRMEGSN